METNARNAYVEAQILTATPQKLRLMLIDAAIKYARLTQTSLQENHVESAYDAGGRLRQIVAELISSISPDPSDLNRQTIALYLYLFQTVTRAQLKNEPELLTDVIAVLELEQQTWRQICEKFPHTIEPPADLRPKEIVASDQQAIFVPTIHGPHTPHPGGFSLDA